MSDTSVGSHFHNGSASPLTPAHLCIGKPALHARGAGGLPWKSQGLSSEAGPITTTTFDFRLSAVVLNRLLLATCLSRGSDLYSS